jgi:hypothetical protein
MYRWTSYTPFYIPQTPRAFVGLCKAIFWLIFYESAKRSVLAAEVLLRRLEAELAELEPIFSDGENLSDRFGPVLISAMGIVDFAHRFGQLMDGMPLIKAPMRSSHLKNLKEALEPVTDTRNHLQHLREELAAGSSIDYPVMGSMTGIRGQQCYTVALLTQGFEVTVPSMVFGSLGIGYVARYQYTVASRGILLDRLVSTMRESFDWLASVISFSDPDYDKFGWGKAVAFSSSMQIEISTAATPAE